MHSKWVFNHLHPLKSKQIFVLVLLWGVGLLFGVLLCTLVQYDTVDVLYGAMCTKPSILGLFLVCVLPVILSAMAVCSPLFPIAYVLIPLSAVSHGFCGMVTYMAVGSASWITRPILLFAASGTTVLMWWLLLQNNTGNRLRKRICLAICLSCLVYVIDLFFVSPFAGDLIKVL